MAIETTLPEQSSALTTLQIRDPIQRQRTAPTVGKLIRTAAQTRLLGLSAQTLSDAELVSLLVPATRRTSAHDIGSQLLSIFGSLRLLLQADPNTAHKHGLTQGGYVALQAALELARRHYQELMQTGSALSNPQSTREYVRMRLRDLRYEVFAAVYLDSHHRVLHFGELFRGTIDGAIVHPREVVKEALSRNAAAMIAVHNHPSGIAEPSPDDRLITTRLKAALALVDIRLIDHLIVGDDSVESFAERGLL